MKTKRHKDPSKKFHANKKPVRIALIAMNPDAFEAACNKIGLKFEIVDEICETCGHVADPRSRGYYVTIKQPFVLPFMDVRLADMVRWP